MSSRLAIALACLGPALAARASDIELSWPAARAEPPGELRIERRAPGGEWTPVGRLPLTATGWIDSGRARDSSWCYRVRVARSGERVSTHAAEHCVGPQTDSAAEATPRRDRVRGGWLQEVEP